MAKIGLVFNKRGVFMKKLLVLDKMSSRERLVN